MTAPFRCECCGFSLPTSYEGDLKDGRCFLCVPLNDEERRLMEREFAESRRRARTRRRARL